MNTMLRQSIMRNKVCQRALSWSCRSTRSNTEVIRAISSSSRTGKSKTDEGGGGGNLAGRDLGVLGGPPEVSCQVNATNLIVLGCDRGSLFSRDSCAWLPTSVCRNVST